MLSAHVDRFCSHHATQICNAVPSKKLDLQSFFLGYARPREQLQKYEMNYDTMQSMKMGAAQLRDSGMNRKSGTNVPDVGNRLPL